MVLTGKSDEEENMRMESDLRREISLGKDLPFEGGFTKNIGCRC